MAAPVSNSSSPPLPHSLAVAQLLQRLKTDRDSILKDGHKELFLARAPGRLDVMGGITDYSGGLVCQYPLAASTAVALQRRDDRKLIIKTYNADASETGTLQSTVELSLDDFYGSASLLSHETLQSLFSGGCDWAAYIAGAFPLLARHKKITRSTHGANIACFSTIPSHAGAGSSAALACATLWAMTAAYHLILDPIEIAVLAQRIENQIAGVPHGVMDQVTSVLGRQDQLLLLECQPHELKGYLAIPHALALIGIFTGKNQLIGEAYRDARVSAFMAQAVVTRLYADLGFKKDPIRGYLANVPAEVHRKYLSLILPERILGSEFLSQHGPIADRATAIEPNRIYAPRAAAEHHTMEVARNRAFIESIRAMDQARTVTPSQKAAAGSLMFESHDSCSRVAGLGSAEADILVRLVKDRGTARGFHGARISGAGCGGTVVILADASAAAGEEFAAILKEYNLQTGLTPITLSGSAPGACEAAPARLPISQLTS